MLLAAKTPPSLLTLILLSGLSVVSLNMFLPSLANISAEFQADYALVNLSIAGYAAMTAVLQLVMGPLSDRLGRRPVILAALAIFIAASIGCLLARDIWTFLAFRMVQGAIITGHAVSLAVIRDGADARKSASLMGYLTMAWALAPMLGPVLGGSLDDLFGWRSNFTAFTVFGVLVFALCWLDLGETNTNRSRTLAEQFRTYPELFASRRFWGYALCMAFSVGAFYAFLAGAPLVAVAVFEVAPSILGIYIGSITAGFIVGSFVAGRFAEQYALTTMMIAGRIVACVGLISGLALTGFGIVTQASVFGACICVGIGNGITMPSSSAGALSVRPQLAGSASGLSGALTVAGGAVMSALTGALIAEQNAIYALLGMMLLSSLLALAAAFYVLRIDAMEGEI